MFKRAGLMVGTVFVLLLCCILPQGPEGEDPVIELVGSSDTVSSFAPVAIVFSQPIKLSANVCLAFDPPNFSYSVVLSKTGDTARINMGVRLEGGTRYTLRLCESIKTDDGNLYRSGKDSVVFYTYPSEQEPNDSPSTADTVIDNITGTLSTIDDTDWFIFVDSTVQSFYFFQYDVNCSLLVVDGGGVALPPSQLQGQSGLYGVPSELEPPFFLSVQSKARSSGGHYRIKLVRD